MVVTDEEKYDYNAVVIERGYAKAHVLSHVFFKYIIIIEIMVLIATMFVPLINIGRGTVDPEPLYQGSLVQLIIDGHDYFHPTYVWMIIGLFCSQFFVSISAFAFIRKKPIELLTLLNIVGFGLIIYFLLTDINFITTAKFVEEKNVIESSTGLAMNAGFSYFILGPMLFGGLSILLGITLLTAKKVIDKKEEGFYNFDIKKVLGEKDLIRLEKHNYKIIAKIKSHILLLKHDLSQVETSLSLDGPGTAKEKEHMDKVKDIRKAIAFKRLKLKPLVSEISDLKQIELKYQKQKEIERNKMKEQEALKKVNKEINKVKNDLFGEE